MRESSSKQIEIACKVIRETEKAILIDHGGKDPVWIPKSQITDHTLDWSSIFISEWLAGEKGLV